MSDDQPTLPGMPAGALCRPTYDRPLEFGVVRIVDGLPIGYLAHCATCGDQLATDDMGRASAWAIDHDTAHLEPAQPAASGPAGMTGPEPG